MKTLVIAEKPSVGRDLARVLDCKQRGDGYLYGDSYVVSWAIGHLVTLQEPEDYNPALKRWKMYDLPILPTEMGLKAIPSTQKQLDILAKLMNSAKTADIICATDSGREGELIFRYIYEWAKCTKPVKRLWISSLTDAAINDGLAKMKDAKDYDNLYASARCRAEADWLVGMNATRAYTLSQGDLLPMGRVQTPTLAILAARHQEIAAFDAKEYWEVKADFRILISQTPLSEQKNIQETYSGTWLNAEGEDRTYDKSEAEAIVAKVKNQSATVESVETEEKRQPPPQLFDLTELQRECNRKLGFSAQKTLTTAQSLYEKHKLITYPRTDSRYLSKDMVPKLPTVVKAMHFPPYEPFTEPLIALPSLPTSSRIVNDAKVTDHHAIIPTGKRPSSNLSPDERAVYDRIIRNFLAVFHPAYIYDVTTIITRCEGEPFRSRGKIDRQLGWTAIYAHEKKSEDTGNTSSKASAHEPSPQTAAKPKAKAKPKTADAADTDTPLPPLQKGDAVTVQKVECLNKKTQPPKPYTEATLLSAMEHAGRFVDDETLKEALKSSGLGTPATRASMIEKLISTGYVERKKKNLTPTEKGLRLIQIVPPEMRQPETTGKWERGLSRIQAGELDDKRFMDSIRRYVIYLIQQAKIKTS